MRGEAREEFWRSVGTRRTIRGRVESKMVYGYLRRYARSHSVLEKSLGGEFGK